METNKTQKRKPRYRQEKRKGKKIILLLFVFMIFAAAGTSAVYLWLTGFFSNPVFIEDVYYVTEGESLAVSVSGSCGSSFSCRDDSVAAISEEGVLSGIDEGTTYVTVSNRYSKADTASVVVLSPPDSLTLMLDKNSVSPGETAVIFYDDGVKEIEHSIVYESLDPEIASVNSSTGEVTGISQGKAMIKGTLYNGIEATITLYVGVTPEDLRIAGGTDSADDTEPSVILVTGETSRLETNEENSEDLVFKSSDTSVVTVDETGILTAKNTGTAVVEVTRYNETASCVVQVIEMPSSVLVDMPQICQKPNHYYACESVSAVMLLQGMGFDITPDTFIDEYLTIKYMSYTEQGVEAADMNSAFINNPYDKSGYGCFSPVIAKSINKYFSDIGETEYKAIYEKDVELDYVIQKYLSKEQPVLLWATTYMTASYPTDSWIINYVDENAEYEIGDIFTFPYNEHCLLLVGYDEYYYYFNDPLYGFLVKYGKELVESRYEQMGKQIVAVVPA